MLCITSTVRLRVCSDTLVGDIASKGGVISSRPDDMQEYSGVLAAVEAECSAGKSAKHCKLSAIRYRLSQENQASKIFLTQRGL